MDGQIAVIVHGGAGRIPGADVPGYNRGTIRAAEVARGILESDGGAIDAALAAVRVMDDDPCFNAGCGAALDIDGKAYLDGAVMEGGGLSAGAVAAVRGVIRHPADLARLIMEKHPSVLLAGEGALEFAREMGVEFVPEDALITPLQIERWKNWLARRAASGADSPGQPEAEPDDGGYDELLENGKGDSQSRGGEDKTGEGREDSGGGDNGGGGTGDTVGAVCRDKSGLIACALSTGGVRGKPRGRVGDTPLIGCGLYADNAVGGAACTGIGEHIIRARLASRALDLIERGRAPQKGGEMPARDAALGFVALRQMKADGGGLAMASAQAAVEFMARRIGGEAGVIMMDAAGNIGYAHSTARMAVAYWTPGMKEPLVDMEGGLVSR